MTINKIKKVALMNFIEKGYEGTSLANIATEVGIKKQSIYSHFKNKDELFITVMNDVIKEETEFLYNFFNNPYIDIKSHLEKFILQIKERYIQNEQNNIKFVLRMAYMPPTYLKDIVINNFNTYFLKLENLINRLFLNDLLLSKNANIATLSFMNMFNGLLVALTYGGTERFNLKLEASWELYWIGLLNI